MFTGWFIGLFTGLFAVWLTGLLTVLFTGWLAVWYTGLLTVYWLIFGLFTGLLTVLLTGWASGLFTGWFAVWFTGFNSVSVGQPGSAPAAAVIGCVKGQLTESAQSLQVQFRAEVGSVYFLEQLSTVSDFDWETI